MLAPSVKSFLKKQEAKPEIVQTEANKQQVSALNREIDDYAWRLRKLEIATKKKNTDAVVNSIDNKYLPAWQDDK